MKSVLRSIAAAIEVVLIPLLLLWWTAVNLIYLPQWIRLAEILRLPPSVAVNTTIALAQDLLGPVGLVVVLIVLIPWGLAMRRLGGKHLSWLVLLNFISVAVLLWMLFIVHATAMEVAAAWTADAPASSISDTDPLALYRIPDLSPVDGLRMEIDPPPPPDGIMRVKPRSHVDLTVRVEKSAGSGRPLSIARPNFSVIEAANPLPDSDSAMGPASLQPKPGGPQNAVVPLDAGGSISFPYQLEVQEKGRYLITVRVLVNLPSGVAVPLMGVVGVIAR